MSRRKLMDIRRASKKRRAVYTALTVLFWLTAWQAASMIVHQSLFMPSPLETFAALGGLAATDIFWLSIAFTLIRVVAGVAVSFILGILLAFLASRFMFFEQLLRPIIAAAKATPVMSIIMLALVWFSSLVPVFACILLCFPIFYTNTLSGLRSVDRQLLEMAAVFRVKHRRVVSGVIVPSVIPHIYAALAMCLGFSWKSVVAAEVLSSPRYALGYRLYETKLYLDTPALFAWTLTIIVISLLLEKGLKRLLPQGEAL
jgi:NitT/TauT family transport system permease protein